MKNNSEKAEHFYFRVIGAITVFMFIMIIGIEYYDKKMDIPVKIVTINSSEQSVLPVVENVINGQSIIVSLNNGTFEELVLIPGIGEKLAQSIIDYRNKIGKFNSLEELMNVKRIGEKTFEKIKPYLKLN